MLLPRTILTALSLFAFAVALGALALSTPVDAKSSKNTSARIAELEKRLQRLEQSVTFVSRGDLFIFGLKTRTRPPTQEEIEKIEEDERGD